MTVCCHCGCIIRGGRTIDGNVSHGICEACIRELYPEVWEQMVNSTTTIPKAERKH